MFYSDLVRKASNICFEAHKNDKDKAGYPYFMHPLTLAIQFNDEASVCVALLHDVIEDHGDKYSFEYLEQEGFYEEIITALKLLTHKDGIDYIEYVKKIKQNPIARKVKLADLRHNSDISRCDGKKPRKYDLYLEAIRILEIQFDTRNNTVQISNQCGNSLKITDGAGLVAIAAMYQKDNNMNLKSANEAGDTYYLLQGRDENGKRSLRESNYTIRYNEKEEKLFANEDNYSLYHYLKIIS